MDAQKQTQIWQAIREEAQALVESEPMLASFFHATIFPKPLMSLNFFIIGANSGD